MINYFRRKALQNRLKSTFGNYSNRRHTFCLFLTLATLGFILGVGILFIFADVPLVYKAVLTEGEKQVYDGDTLKDVRIVVWNPGFLSGNKPPKEPQELWAGVWIMPNGNIEVETDIRIAGIDTPEKRASTKNPDGSKRSEASRNREKAAAAAARQALIDLLKDNKYEMRIRNPQHGKYAGRTVADVIVIDEDVARYLILRGHAKAYDGGTKPTWDWGE